MIPPRWVFRIGWAFHKALFAASGGRIGAERPHDGKVGTLFLLSTGRKSGTIRRNALFYSRTGRTSSSSPRTPVRNRIRRGG